MATYMRIKMGAKRKMVGTNKAFKIPSLIENTVACPHKQDKTKSNIRYLSKLFVKIILFSRIAIIISYF